MGEVLCALCVACLVLLGIALFAHNDKSFVKLDNCDPHGGSAAVVNYDRERAVVTCKDGERYSIYVKDLGR